MHAKRIYVLLTTFVGCTIMLSCASNAPQADDHWGHGEGRARPERGSHGEGSSGFVPAANWWHDPAITSHVTLTAEQVQKLDALQKEQGDDIGRMERDSMVAMRDLRSTIDGPQPSEADIMQAGKRLRELRDDMFDRQVRMVAAERLILTGDEWQTLREQLDRPPRDDSERRQTGNRNGYGRGRRRGGFPG